MRICAVGPIPNERPYRDLTEILRNSAFWTDYRLPEGTRFWGYFPIGDKPTGAKKML